MEKYPSRCPVCKFTCTFQSILQKRQEPVMHQFPTLRADSTRVACHTIFISSGGAGTWRPGRVEDDAWCGAR